MIKLIILFLGSLLSSATAQEPELKGGLSDFLKRNIIYPSYALQNCIQGNVQVGFKVNAAGKVYDATIVKGIGADLDNEALRLIKLSTNQWIVPSTHDVNSLVIVPIQFTLNGYGCERKSKGDVEKAIAAYKAEEELTNVILNFYRGKEKGAANLEDEPKIKRIKTELNIDDEYLDARIETGLKKIKQGDVQGACEDFTFVKYMGSDKADNFLMKYCK